MAVRLTAALVLGAAFFFRPGGVTLAAKNAKGRKGSPPRARLGLGTVLGREPAPASAGGLAGGGGSGVFFAGVEQLDDRLQLVL
jgi:hypothetical protein